MTDKKNLRKEIKELSLALSEDYKKTASAAISKHVLESSDFINARSVFVYISSPNEPDTKEILRAAFLLGKAVFVPLCTGKGIMEAVRIYPDTPMKSGFMGISEPDVTAPVSPSEIDLSVIPCISASRDKRRLGHGGGYYDRFLSVCRTKAVCICFDRLMRDDIPTESHDITPHAVISESGIYT